MKPFWIRCAKKIEGIEQVYNMTKDISKFWIFSDVDGTLVEAPAAIPENNITALKRFTELGGHFAIATGRSEESALSYVQQLPVNAPCIIYNGSVIYDFAKKKMLYAQYLPPMWKRYVALIKEAFPSAGITLLGEKMYASVSAYPYVQKYLVDIDHVVPECRELEQVTEPCIKAIAVLPEDQIGELEAFVTKQAWSDVTISRSSPFFLELLPPDTDKGSGLKAYSRLYQIPIENTVAIGDYYNDEAMLRVAGYPVTVDGAPDDIKSLCRYVAGNCMDGALANLVAHLESL